jgi:hypothetical protein
MKKTFLHITTAAALLVAMIFTGCSREESNNDGPRTLVLKIGKSATRAETAAVTSNTPTFTDGWVFVVNGSGVILNALKIGPNTGDDVSVATLTTSGKKFAISASAQKVHIFGNVGNVTAWPGTLTAANAIGRNISTLTGVALTVANLSVTDGVTKVPLYGVDGITLDSGTDYVSEPELVPVASRIEITKVTADPAGMVSAFTVTDILINHYYPSRTLVGGDGLAKVAYTKDDDYTYGTAGDNYYGLSGILYDNVNKAATNVSGTMTATPASSKVWAYNLPVPAVTTDYFPHIVLKLTGVTTTGDGAVSNVTKYLTVKSASKVGEGKLEFTKGKIYTIANLSFTKSDLSDTPEPEEIYLTVTVEVTDWEVIPIVTSF